MRTSSTRGRRWMPGSRRPTSEKRQVAAANSSRVARSSEPLGSTGATWPRSFQTARARRGTQPKSGDERSSRHISTAVKRPRGPCCIPGSERSRPGPRFGGETPKTTGRPVSSATRAMPQRTGRPRSRSGRCRPDHRTEADHRVDASERASARPRAQLEGTRRPGERHVGGIDPAPWRPSSTPSSSRDVMPPLKSAAATPTRNPAVLVALERLADPGGDRLQRAGREQAVLIGRHRGPPRGVHALALGAEVLDVLGLGEDSSGTRS